MTRRGSDLAVAGQERGAEQLSERHVCSIISRECWPEFPTARNKEIMRIAAERQVAEILERFLASTGR